MVGGELECVLCDRFELPAGHAAYKRTPIFHRGSIPDGLRKNHATKPGVWGVIHVVSGLLRYVIQPPLAGEHDLDPLRPGIVVPEVLHHVSPTGDVELYVEFFRATGRRDDSVAG